MQIGRCAKFLLITLLLLGCSRESHFSGQWQLDIKLQGDSLPVVVELTQSDKQISGHLYNSTEVLTLQGMVEDQTARLNIGPHYAKLELKRDGDQIKGQWIRTNKENYKVALTGSQTAKKYLFKPYESIASKHQVDGQWRVSMGKDREGLAYFEQRGARVFGSVITPTGDYRYLDGFIQGNKLQLHGFDGVFAFIFKLDISDKKLSGEMLAGKNSRLQFVATRDEHFKLIDPNQMTKLVSTQPVKFSGVDIFGQNHTLEKIHKPKIIQLFGSWCPNCIDETKFFIKWRKDHPKLAKKIQFIALAFENFSNEKLAIKALKKIHQKLLMDYPIVLVDYLKQKHPEDILPIDKGRAFPTTIFLDKNNQVIKIHTGFAGQATGPFFKLFEQDFDQTVKQAIDM